MNILSRLFRGSTPGTRKTITIEGEGIICATVSGSVDNGTMNLTQIVRGACPTDPGVEPPGRVRRASLVYPPSTVPRAYDLLEWDDLFGRIGHGQVEHLFPGINCNVIAKNIPRGGYLALAFSTVGFATTLRGALKSVSNFPGAHIDMCIHALPGRFEGWAPYFKTAIPPDDNPFLNWRLTTGTAFFAKLPPVGYLNLRLTNPAIVGDIHIASTVSS